MQQLFTQSEDREVKVTFDGFSEEDKDVKWKSTVSCTVLLLALFLQRQHKNS